MNEATLTRKQRIALWSMTGMEQKGFDSGLRTDSERKRYLTARANGSSHFTAMQKATPRGGYGPVEVSV